MFENLVKALRGKGMEAEESAICAGQYYDGADHGQVFPVVRVKTDLSVPFSVLDRICNRRGLVYDWRSCYGTSTRLFTIWQADDRAEAKRLDDVARAFLDAFWLHRHEHGPNDQAGMIEAGRRAVAAMEGRA